MRDEGPGQSEDPRIALERATGELGQSAVEPAREVVPDLLNLLLRDVEVVDQPLVRRRDGALLAEGLLDVSIRVEQHPAVVLEASVEVSAGLRTGGDLLSSRKAFRVLLEALDAEQFAANQLVRVGCEYLGWPPEWPKK